MSIPKMRPVPFPSMDTDSTPAQTISTAYSLLVAVLIVNFRMFRSPNIVIVNYHKYRVFDNRFAWGDGFDYADAREYGYTYMNGFNNNLAIDVFGGV